MNKTNPSEEYFSSLRQIAEAKLKNTESKHVSSIEHELSVHEIELQMQNEELLATQDRLNTTLQEYEELFELSPLGYFILDKNGTIKKVNERGSAQLGVHKTKLIGKPFSVFVHDESAQDDFYRYRNLAMKTGSAQPLECKMKRNENTVFSVLIKSTVVIDEQSRFKHLLLMTNDISALKEHEQQVKLALAKSEELNALKSRFISLASHEFRTPLAAILSSTSLMEQYERMEGRDKMKKHLMRIKSSVKDLTNMLDDFLSVENIESNKVKIVHESFSLPELCEVVLKNVHVGMKENQHIKYSHTGPDTIRGDKKIVQHILQNLLANACKYSKEDTEISLSTGVNKGIVSIKVKDYGIGIPEAEQKNVFTRFFRATNAVNIPGLGLGLNAAKRYLEFINGTIDFSSELNKGTTFIVKFPCPNAL